MLDKKTLSYVKCSPGGNTTTLVFTNVPRNQQAGVANQIMAVQADVEQVGFVEPPENSRATARLQMMGGEFCGNALRSLAWVLVNTPESPAWRKQRILFEASGTQKLLYAQITDENVTVEMPIKQDLNSVRRIGDKTIVALEGISHVLVAQPPPGKVKSEANHLLTELGLKTLAAAGVIYYEPYAQGIALTPVVWVRNTETLVEESACASGTICLALAYAAESKQAQVMLRVYQPSGGIIMASVEKKAGAFVQAFITGPVDILEKGEITVMIR